jgi:signal recognition particle receptor subunit beta
MVQINFAQKEIQCKIVYYGPGMSGKTTNLEIVHGKAPAQARGELTSIATTGERTLYFDYMPLDLGQIAGIKTKFQLYTVPGQVYYKSTRRLVLQGVDGVVFVADSSAAKLRENQESLQDLEENLKELGKTLKDVPIIIQYNKRDMPDAMSVADLEKQVNVHGFPYTEAIAKTGEGVFPTLKTLSSRVLEAVNKGGLSGSKVKPATAKPADAAPTKAVLAAPPTAGQMPAVSRSSATHAAPSGRMPVTVAAQAAPSFHGSAATALAEPHTHAQPHATSQVAPHADPQAAPAAQPRSLQDRVVPVSGLAGPRPAAKVVALLLLAAGAAAAFFLLR